MNKPLDAFEWKIDDGNLNENTEVSVKATIHQTGYFRIILRHTALQEFTKNQLFINGDCYGEFSSSVTDRFVDEEVCTVFLSEGEHNITIQRGWGGIYIKSILIEKTNKTKLPFPSFTLNNPKATPEAKSLMNYFKDVYTKKIITGQHTAYASGPELNHIKKMTGKLPAVRGFDLLSYSLHTNTEEETEDKILEINENKGSTEEAIKWAKEKNGIVTFCWHWYAPSGGKDKTFYTENTDFDLQAALEPTSPYHQALLEDMDTIAEQLKRLQAENIPVLWRPLHEAEGRWFWWGAKGPEPYKQLYKWMYDRFMNYHELDNLIWVWNAPASEWYPGDEYCDLAGMDIYVPAGNYGPLKVAFEQAASLTNHQKPIALTENGPIPDPDKLIESETPWLWYMPWYGNFVTDGIQTETEQLKKVYDHPYCITLDQLPNLKNYGK